MAEEPGKVTVIQIAGEAESGYPKILATDDDGILKAKGDG